MTLTNDQLSQQLTQMMNSITARLDKLEKNSEDLERDLLTVAGVIDSVKEVIRIVKGSNGQEGLITKIDRIQTNLERHTHMEATAEVRRALYGDTEHEGLMHQVEELRKWRASLDRWSWFLATTMIVSMINLIITLAFSFFGVGGP